jgi:hypothetical protein
LELDEWPEGMNLTFEDTENEEATEQFVIRAVSCEDIKAF